MGKSKVVLFVVLFLSFALLSGHLLTAGGAAKEAKFAKDRILVKFKPGLSPNVGLSAIKTFSSIRVHVLQVPSGQSAVGWVKKLSRDPRVEYAELDFVRTIDVIPNDTRFGELWGMNNTGQTGGTAGADIDAPAAWDLETGSSSVVVAVIDTGVDYTHGDLSANMWTNPGEIPGNGIDDDGNGYIDDVYGINSITGSGDPMDDHYHGTHCSGTIGARGNNSLGVAGVCWDVKIMALKFLDSGGSGYTSDAITCIEYAVAKGANIMSNSWGGGGFDQSLKDAIDAAQTAGLLFIAAAGNAGSDTDTYPNYPSCYDSANIISVAATDHNDALAYFSNYGATTVDVGAPGVDILSTQPGNLYQLLSGTSMATPHVAGLAALLKSYNSSWTWQDVKSRIMAGTVALSGLSGKCITGGRINAYNSLVVDMSVPHIYTIKPSAASPGATVNVSGFGFGDSQGAGKVVFTPDLEAAVVSWSDSQIVCTVPSLTQTGNVVVQNSLGETSNAFWFVLALPYYLESQVTNEFTGGGTAQGWQADDGVWTYPLPFAFVYFGKTHAAGTLIYVSSNGFIDFASTTADYRNSEDVLKSRTRIAPLWMDLVTNGSVQTGENIYISSNSTRLVIRWCAETWYFGDPMNFELILQADGKIKFNYGPGNSYFSSYWTTGPTIGLADYSSGYAHNMSVYDGLDNLTYVQTDLYSPPAFAVTAPVTGDQWSRGYTKAITWDKGTSASSFAKIQLYKGNTKVKDIALKATNSGSYSWPIPAALGVATNYRIKITTTDNIFSAFSGYFSIVKPSITITSPAAGVTWTRGTGYQITWNKAGEQNASVSIQLFKGTKMVQTISPSAPNSGSFSWTVPTSLAAGINYKVKIKTVDNLVTAISKLFKIN